MDDTRLHVTTKVWGYPHEDLEVLARRWASHEAGTERLVLQYRDNHYEVDDDEPGVRSATFVFEVLTRGDVTKIA